MGRKSAGMERFTETQIWYIVFDVVHGVKPWWLPFVHERFQHVLLCKEALEGSVVVNPMSHVLSVRHYPNSIVNIVGQEIDAKPTAVLQYAVHYGAHYKPAPLEIITCVTTAKRILGIRNRWIVTPYQLYKELLRAGAIALKPY